MAIDDVTKITETITWRDITEGCKIEAAGNSRLFNTGEWRVDTPVFIAEKCNQCLLCVPVCPDSSIPVEDYKRADFDYEHCKGCGICVKACPTGAIEMKKGGK
ncbi:MAG: 4Fe-4S dicluster domain-containing protein [Pelotomaculum sp.]|jgi:pyruvate ferredoxin oxidoreductase delta subunit